MGDVTITEVEGKVSYNLIAGLDQRRPVRRLAFDIEGGGTIAESYDDIHRLAWGDEGDSMTLYLTHSRYMLCIGDNLHLLRSYICAETIPYLYPYHPDKHVIPEGSVDSLPIIYQITEEEVEGE